MLSINKNPDKIKKTAETHKGMKRSKETCLRISQSLKGVPSSTIGRTTIWNIETKEVVYVSPDSEIPTGWNWGRPKETRSRGKAYNNGYIMKLFKPCQEIPEGWVEGALPKPRKKHAN